MCLAIYKPEKVRLIRADLKRAFDANSDGAGFAYYDNSQQRVIIEKGFFSFNEFWRAFQEVQRDNLKAIVHFRFATHGSVDTDNCHPYELNDGALIHNGIIDCVSSAEAYYSRYTTSSPSKYYEGWDKYEDIDGDPVFDRNTGTVTGTYDKNGDWYESAGYVGERPMGRRSDTREFVEDWLSGMTEKDMRRAKSLIEYAIGDYSKLVTLHNSGRHIIFNEEAGHWDRGAWWSNACYKPSPPPKITPVTTYVYRDGKLVEVTELKPNGTTTSQAAQTAHGIVLPSKEYVEEARGNVSHT